MIRVYTQKQQGQRWLQRYRGQPPLFACVLGFTKTGLIPGISAAGATPDDRRYTAIADAEFLYNGPQTDPCYPLPPLQAGASPVLISRAVIKGLQLPVYVFNAGLPQPPAIPAIDLLGAPAQCLSTGKALELRTVEHLLQQGLRWGKKLADEAGTGYLILSECVVGGTTTALALLTALDIPAAGKINSSHPTCNHEQKWELVKTGLERAGLWEGREMGRLRDGEVGEDVETLRQKDTETFQSKINNLKSSISSLLTPHSSPLTLVAAVGDPMQVVVAGMAIAASCTCGVLLAGGTQMLAVYALARAIAYHQNLPWQPEQIVVGTTRWVAEDPTGDTVGLAHLIGSVPLIATQLSFVCSQFPQLQAYEQGFVKEGVGAGGCAITAHLYQGWDQDKLLQAIELLVKVISKQ